MREEILMGGKRFLSGDPLQLAAKEDRLGRKRNGEEVREEGYPEIAELHKEKSGFYLGRGKRSGPCEDFWNDEAGRGKVFRTWEGLQGGEREGHSKSDRGIRSAASQ